jgi:hypothetical protein
MPALMAMQVSGVSCCLIANPNSRHGHCHGPAAAWRRAKKCKNGQKIKVARLQKIAILFFYISIKTPLQGGMIFKKSLLFINDY